MRDDGGRSEEPLLLAPRSGLPFKKTVFIVADFAIATCYGVKTRYRRLPLGNILATISGIITRTPVIVADTALTMREALANEARTTFIKKVKRSSRRKRTRRYAAVTAKYVYRLS